MSLQLDTPIIDLSLHGVAHLSHFMAKKLAAAVASYADKSDASTATVEDLLNYFPVR